MTLVGAFAIASIGVLVGAVSTNIHVAVILAQLLYVPLMMIGGTVARA